MSVTLNYFQIKSAKKKKKKIPFWNKTMINLKMYVYNKLAKLNSKKKKLLSLHKNKKIVIKKLKKKFTGNKIMLFSLHCRLIIISSSRSFVWTMFIVKLQ